MLKILKDIRGITIVEVIVSAGMTAIVAGGIASMMQNAAIEQRKVVLMDTLKNQKQKFEFLIRDQASWTQTINSATNNATIFDQIRASSSVSTVGANYTTPVKIVLFDSTGSAAMSTFLGPGETGTNGLTEKGQVCTTFSTVTGNDACPISYKVMMGAACESGTSCSNPQLKIVARLLFNPSPTGTLIKFRDLINPVAGEIITDGTADGKYDASVKRTSSSTNRSFRLVAKFNPTATGCGSAGLGGAGQCTVSPGVHPTTNAGWVEDYDTNNLVQNTGASVNFREKGYYGCMISAPAFATGGFSLRLVNTSASNAIVAMATTTAGQWAQSTAVIDTKFNVTSTTDNYQIWQSCDDATSAGHCALGMGVSPYTDDPIIVSLSCYKLDRSM